MTVNFRIVEHLVNPGVHLVEVLLNGAVIGTIYPKNEGILVVSAHFSEKEFPQDFDGEIIEDNGESKFPPIPGLYVTFKPRKYYFIGNKIKYIE